MVKHGCWCILKLLFDVVWQFINPKYVVGVEFKWLIDNVALVDKLLNLLNIVVVA